MVIEISYRPRKHISARYIGCHEELTIDLQFPLIGQFKLAFTWFYAGYRHFLQVPAVPL